MKKEFLKIAGVENEKDFYKLFPTEQAFFGMFPEAKKLVQKRYGGLINAEEGLGVTAMTTMPIKQNDNVQTNVATRQSAAAPSPTAEQLAALNPNIARNPMFRTFSGNLKFNWGDPSNRNIFSYGLTKERENPYYSHAGTLGFNNLFGPGRGKFNLTGTYTPKTGQYNAGFNFGLPSKRMIGEGDEAEPKSNFTAGFGIMQNPKGNIERKAEAKYNTRLGTKASDPTLSIGVNAGFKYGGGLVKAIGGFNVTSESTRPSMTCGKEGCKINNPSALTDNSMANIINKQKQPKPTTPWQNITSKVGLENENEMLKKEWEQTSKNYPGLTYDEFFAANQLERYNRLNQPQYNNYFDEQGNPIEGKDPRAYSSQPYIPWVRSTFNNPTPSRETIMRYFQDYKLNKNDIENLVNERYTPKNQIAPSYFRAGGALTQFQPGGSNASLPGYLQVRDKQYGSQGDIVNRGMSAGTKAALQPQIKEEEAIRNIPGTRPIRQQIYRQKRQPVSTTSIGQDNRTDYEKKVAQQKVDDVNKYRTEVLGLAEGTTAEDIQGGKKYAERLGKIVNTGLLAAPLLEGALSLGARAIPIAGRSASRLITPSATSTGQSLQSGIFNTRDLGQMFRNPKQYFTKPGGPQKWEVNLNQVSRMNRGEIDPFGETGRFITFGETPARVIDWGKIGQTALELGLGTGAATSGAYLGNKASKKKIGGELEEFAPGGFLTTDETTKYPPLQSDVDILNKGRKELLDWYTARVNHSDPRISGEARQVLENFSKLPSDVSKGIEYKGVHYLIPQGLLGQYMPYDETIEIANPYLSIEEQLKKPGFGYINKNPELRDRYIKAHQLSRTEEPIKHEGKHRDLHKTVEPILDQYSDQIYSGFAGPEVYAQHLYERIGKPDLSKEAAGKWAQANFDRDAGYAYHWMTGTGFPNFRVNKKGNVKNMKNSELYRALMELRTEYGIDPAANTTSEDFKNIYEKAKKSYEDAIQNKDPEKRLRYEHFLDLFNIHGNDFEKLNNLNNLLVGVEDSSLPIADEGFNVTSETTDPSFLDKTLLAGKAVGTLFSDMFNPIKIAERQEKKPYPLVIQMVDPTGYTNWGNVKTSYNDMMKARGFWPTLGQGTLFTLDALSTIPVVGKIPKAASSVVKGSKAVAKGSKAAKPKIMKEVIARPITNIDRLTGANKMFPIPTTSKVLNAATNFTNLSNRGRRYMTGLFGGIDYGLGALSNLGSQDRSALGPTISQSKKDNDSSYVDKSRGDVLVTVKTPDGKIVKMSTGSKAYSDFLNRIEEGSYSYDDKTGIFIVKKYKK
jgi:hypothetical protein